MRLVLFVEGKTEELGIKDFFMRWLVKQGQRIGIRIVRFKGASDLRKRAASKAVSHLRSKDVVAVIVLLDLYQAFDYPKTKTNAAQRYEWGRKTLQKEVGNGRIKCFFAVHETEAWLLSDPSIFPAKVKTEIAGKSAHPEKVNFDKPPAKLLNAIYQKKMHCKYRKTVDGPKLFKKLDPETARGKCPRLKELLDEMLRMAQDAAAA